MKIKDEICFEELGVVSFDFFDTLVFRDVKVPKQVFEIVSIQYQKIYGITLNNFVNNRVEAEHNARVSFNREVTLEEIYSFFPNTYSNITRKRLANLEKQTELQITIPNSEMLDILYYAKSIGKKVIIISDFYMGKEFIQAVLDKHNISVDNIFVSCDIGETKSEGNIYHYVTNQVNVEAHKILHIGDNYVSDYKNAIKNGFQSIWYERTIYKEKRYRFYNIENVNSDHVDCFISNRIRAFSKEVDYADGYSVMGPMLFGFCNWLHSEIIKEGIDIVFFLSRDGKIIKSAFDILFDDIKTNYLYASRRALQVPSISSASDIDEAIGCVNLEDKATIERIFLKLGMSETWIRKFCETHAIDSKQYINVRDLMQNDSAKEMLFHESFSEIKNNADYEKSTYLNYLHEMNFRGKVAIVDIGWYGSMQEALLSLCGENVDIYGYYIGVDPFAERQKYLKMKGYLFDGKHNVNLRKIQAKFNPVFELIFSSNHGSVIRIDEEMQPIFNENENTKNWEILGKYQAGALNFVRDFNCESATKEIELPCVINLIFNFFIYPRVDVSIKWSAMDFYDYGHSIINKIYGMRYYLFHPLKFVKDYRSSWWRFGFITANVGKRLKFYKLDLIKSWIDTILRR